MQDIDFQRGVWAVASAPGFGLVIGAMHPLLPDVPDVVSHALEGNAVLIDPCLSFHIQLLPMQGPGGAVALSALRQALPLGACSYPGTIRTKVTGVLLFQDMKETDRERHKALVRDLLEQLIAKRAQDLGILPGRPGDFSPHGSITRP